MEFLGIAILVAIMVINYKIAENNGRNTLLAVIWAFLFGIFAVAVYLIMGKKKPEVNYSDNSSSPHYEGSVKQVDSKDIEDIKL